MDGGIQSAWLFCLSGASLRMGESQAGPRAIEPYDMVRVLVDVPETRSLGGSGRVARGPLKGDIGTVLEVWGDDDPLFLAECIDQEGWTIWVCDFSPGEIELFRRWGRGEEKGVAGVLARGRDQVEG